MTSKPLVSLLCLPCGGASAAIYARWRLHLPRWIHLVPVELPGRGSRAHESFSCNIDELVEQLCLEHARVLETPYALFGHSMGGLLAYHMARYLQQQGRALPLMLFASASPAPSSGNWKFSACRGDEALLRDLHRYGGTPDDVLESPEMLRMALDALAADYVLCSSFEYRGPAHLPIPLRIFGGRDDEVRQEQLAAWRRETTGSFSLHWFDGGHFYLRPHEKQVVRLIEQQLTDTLKTRKENSEAVSPALPA
jgi:surfactin synthase thioesterase subunit